MRVVVNGEAKDLPASCSVKDLLEDMGLAQATVAVERNEMIVRRATHAEVLLAEGDVIEIVHFVGGG